MRVAFLNQYARPADSAGITRHADIGAELVRRGHAVTIVASSYDYLRRAKSEERFSIETGADGVQFLWLDTGTYSGNDRGRVVSMTRFGQAAARATIRLRPRPDVVVGSSAHLLAGLAALVAARRLGVPWVLEVRDFWPSALVDLGAIKPNGIAHRALNRLERYLYQRARRIVSVPPNGALRLTELALDASKLVHIPNASAARPVREPVPASLEADLDRFAGRFVVAYTGSLGEAQHLEVALEALATMTRAGRAHADRIGLVVVGDGVKRADLVATKERLSLDNVLIHSSIPKGAVSAVVSRADACLLQLGAADFLKYGLSPNKLFDYFAAGKPVLISSAYPTVVDENGAGIRFEPGRPEAFADAVVRLMETPESERLAMGARGRELVRTRYSIAAITDTYEALLQEVISEYRS